MGRTLPVRLVRGRLCSARLGMYSAEYRRLWLDVPLVNDSERYWFRTIAPIVSPVPVRGGAVCLIWSRRPEAIRRKLFGIDRYAWPNLVTMWLCVGVVRFLSNKMWILNRIKLWKIRENPSGVVARLSPHNLIWRMTSILAKLHSAASLLSPTRWVPIYYPMLYPSWCATTHPSYPPAPPAHWHSWHGPPIAVWRQGPAHDGHV